MGSEMSENEAEEKVERLLYKLNVDMNIGRAA